MSVWFSGVLTYRRMVKKKDLVKIFFIYMCLYQMVPAHPCGENPLRAVISLSTQTGKNLNKYLKFYLISIIHNSFTDIITDIVVPVSSQDRDLQLSPLFNKLRRSRLRYRSINYLQIIIIRWQIMYTYYTKTDDRWYTSYYGQRLRLGSTRLILYLFEKCTLKTTKVLQFFGGTMTGE